MFRRGEFAVSVCDNYLKSTRDKAYDVGHDMAGNRSTSLPQFDSVQALTDHFDTHDMGEYLNNMAEVQFDVDIQRRQYLVAVDAEVMRKLSEIAEAQQVSAGALINAWLRELASKAA